MNTLVNIGLATRNGAPIPPRLALAALSVIGGAAPLHAEVRQSDTEPTLVAELRHPLNFTAAYAVAEHLRQDAIAQFDGREGHLIGPNATSWGEFDPTLFLTLDGSRLAAPLARAA